MFPVNQDVRAMIKGYIVVKSIESLSNLYQYRFSF